MLISTATPLFWAEGGEACLSWLKFMRALPGFCYTTHIYLVQRREDAFYFHINSDIRHSIKWALLIKQLLLHPAQLLMTRFVVSSCPTMLGGWACPSVMLCFNTFCHQNSRRLFGTGIKFLLLCHPKKGLAFMLACLYTGNIFEKSFTNISVNGALSGLWSKFPEPLTFSFTVSCG